MLSPRELLRRQPTVAYLLHQARAAWRARQQKLVMTPLGFKLCGSKLMQCGEFEISEVALLSSLMPRHQRFIDIGANIGLYSCLARSLGVPSVSIEPLQANLRLLLANLAANGWNDAEVVATGLSARPGISEIFGDGTGASLLQGWALLPSNTLLRERIPLTTLDTVIARRFEGERLLLKIDVEGAEYDVLLGAEQTLQRTPAPTWLIEICLDENFPGGRNPRFAETFDIFYRNGYRIECANAARTPVTEVDVARWAAAGRAEHGAHNYIFYR